MGMRHAAVMAGLALGLMSGTARADKIVTFHASGLFQDGASLGGTYTVDTTTGVATAIDLTFGAPVSSDVTILDGTALYEGLFQQQAINNTQGPNFYPGLSLVINTSSLVGYEGGTINDNTTLYLDSNNSNNYTQLVSGSLSAVPLPASAPMFGAALIALGAAGYGLKRKSKAAARA